MEVRTRFAPSPTGFMHIGNLRTGLYAYLFAKHNGGKFILRIEDTDRERYVEGAEELVYRTLASAGIIHDEGPDVGGQYGPYVQSERLGIYKEYAEKLVDLGGAYYCFCSKERLESLHDSNGVGKYDKHCLSLSKEEVKARIAAGEPYVIRQNIPASGVSEYDDMVYGHISVDVKDMDDCVLLKSDGYPTYNFANVIDDHLMNITHVIRGSEYLSSTPQYNLLYDAFGWERPKYIHLPPIMKDATRKLSKRYGDANYEDFIGKGYMKEAIVNYVALLGWSPKNDVEKMSLDELIASFGVQGLNNSPSIFDEAKLKWLNQEYVKELSVDKFEELARPFFEKSKVAGKYDYKKLSALLIQRTVIFSDIPALVDFLEEYDKDFDANLYCHKKMKTDLEVAKKCMPILIDVINDNDWDMELLHEKIAEAAEKYELKKGQLLWCLRIAVTGKESTPGGAFEMAELVGKQKCLERLAYQSSRL